MRRSIFVGLILMLSLSACTRSADAQASGGGKETGFIALFNGKDLSGWTYGEGRQVGEGYRVRGEGDRAEMYCSADNGGNIFTEKTYDDFILRLEFRLTPGANNGIGLRAPLDGRVSSHGMEIQVLDDTAEQYKDLRPTQYHGSIYDLVPAKRRHLKPVGEWNRQEIIARGSHVTVKLNGTTIVDADLSSITDPGVLEKHPGIRNRSGHIGFLGHGSEVSFRNVRIKPL